MIRAAGAGVGGIAMLDLPLFHPFLSGRGLPRNGGGKERAIARSGQARTPITTGMSRRFARAGFLTALSLLLLLLTSLAQTAATAQAASARCAHADRVMTAARSFISAARSGSPRAFANALRRHLAMRRIALFALGRERRRMSPAELKQYLRLTTSYIARNMAARSGIFRNARVEITACRGNVVEGRVLPRGQQIRWRLSRGRIVDVYLDGIWLALALRDHFRALLRRSRGDMRTFLAMLR